MKNLAKILITILFFASLSYGFALVWWQAWMHEGVIGPVPFLHWFVAADGESSYILVALEI